jgi:MFS transporter, FHS family, L-fucose permease
METKSNLITSIVLIILLFFLWGFAHSLDPILIPYLKHSFTLSTVQATLADSAVFILICFIVVTCFGIGRHEMSKTE